MQSEGCTEDYIVAIGCLDDFSMNIFSAPYDGFKVSLEVAEAAALRDFGDYLLHSDDNLLLSYNGVEFDIPFIVSKLIRYGGETNHNIAKLLLEAKHIDLMGYAKFVTGRRLAKDDACRKLANLYVPRKSEGLWNARIYKNPQLLSENDHLEMLQHNATDLTATARLYNVVKHFPDFAQWRLKEANDVQKP
jgi:uncharacterized protein YprB with RNaseH-like and TPR domain